MAIPDQEPFEIGTDAFSARDLDRFAALLADDVVFEAPGGMRGRGKTACIESYRRWFDDFPDARVQVHGLDALNGGTVDEGTFTGASSGVTRTRRSVAPDYFLLLRVRDGKHVSLNFKLDRLLKRERLGFSRRTTG